MKHLVRKVLTLMMALSLGLVMTGMTALAASANAAAPLKDGNYTVNVQLWHASKDQASMAASCVKDTADVSVKNGKATMTVHTQPMSMAGITASMQTMSVKQSNGTMKAATVVEKSSDGDPTAFRFDVPSYDEYIPVEVNPMIDIMGNKPMDARLKVDWSSAKTAEGTDAESSATKSSDLLSSLRGMLPTNSKTDTTSSATKKSEEPAAEETTKDTVADRLSTLTQKPVNKNDLADGTYTVGVQLWHSEKDQASMAAVSLKPQAKVVVKNGKATMYIYTRPMTFGNITASLQEMKVQNKDGSWSDAQVASRSSDGNPTSFRFALPSTDEYIPVQVNPHVEMMGNRFLDARIKVDWDSLKATTSTNAEDPNGKDSSEPVVVNNVPNSDNTATVTESTTLDGTRAAGVDTGEHTDWSMMIWYAVAVGAGTFALCFAVLKRGLI